MSRAINNRYQLYMHNDSNFYEYNMSDKDEFVIEKYDIYEVKKSVDWKYYSLIEEEIPNQGWKIHISTHITQATETLNIVANILYKEKVSFKHVISNKNLKHMYSKSGDRLSSGKFITIYPKDINQFEKLLNIIGSALENMLPGPYILTDEQWKNSNVFYRYGAFISIKNEYNEDCIFDSKGNKVVDVRAPFYYVPDFVEVPEFLKNEQENDLDNTEENKLNEYEIEKSLLYSNSGGIYLAKRVRDGKKVIIKESRNAIGYDSTGKSAQERLYTEYSFLKELDGVKEVVSVYDYFSVWKSDFLVEEYVQGQSLDSYIANNYPFHENDEKESYYNNIIDILSKIFIVLKKIHEKGICIGDLQPANIMLDEQFNVRIIDLETAGNCDENSIGLATKGFVNSSINNRKDMDWYALICVCKYCALPICPVSDYDEKLIPKHNKWIRENTTKYYSDFYIKFVNECINQLNDAAVQLYVTDLFTNNHVEYLTSENIIEGLVEGIISISDSKSNNFCNGDIRQYETNAGMYNYLTGGFGIAYALKMSGKRETNINDWIKNTIYIKDDTSLNKGFLTGMAGIASILYMYDYKIQAIEIFDNIMENYNIDIYDISLRSGLSGVALAFVSLYKETGSEKYLKYALKLSDIITRRLVEGQKLCYTDWESEEHGLVDGYSGVSLLYTALFRITNNIKHKTMAKYLIDKDILSEDKANMSGDYKILDKHNRTLPYFECGGVGVAIARNYYMISTDEHIYKTIVSKAKENYKNKNSYNVGLFSGYIGMLFQTEDEKYIEEALNLYIVNNNNMFVPGYGAYKLSMDIYTGAAGVIVGLIASHNKDMSIRWVCQSKPAGNLNLYEADVPVPKLIVRTV